MSRSTKKTEKPDWSISKNSAFAEKTFSSWKEFKSEHFDIIRSIQSSTGFNVPNTRPEFLFRGQSCADWPLWSNFDRLMEERGFPPSDVKELYTEMLSSFFDNGLEIEAFTEHLQFHRGGDFREVEKSSELLSALEAYAQHHSLPTRLLDWSESPYIAAFFAASQPEKCSSQHLAIWCLDANGARDLFTEHELFVQDRYTQSGRRQIWQRACFTINRTNLLRADDLFYEDPGRFHRTPQYPVLFKFRLPVTESKNMMEDLDFMRINYLSIYPDLHGVVAYARAKMLASLDEKMKQIELQKNGESAPK